VADRVFFMVDQTNLSFYIQPPFQWLWLAQSDGQGEQYAGHGPEMRWPVTVRQYAAPPFNGPAFESAQSAIPDARSKRGIQIDVWTRYEKRLGRSTGRDDDLCRSDQSLKKLV